MTQTQPSTRAAAAARTSALIPGRLPLTVNTSASPAVVTLDGELIVFYKGANDDPGIYISRSNSSAQEQQQQWTNAVRLPPQVNTSAGPSALVDGDTLYVFYKGANTDATIYVLRSMDAGSTWYMGNLPNVVNTSDRPDATAMYGTLYVLYKGANTDPGVYVTIVPNNVNWTYIS